MEEPRSLTRPGSRGLQERFGAYRRLTVRQRKKWFEILLSFELRNAYDVYDDAQMPVLRVREEGSGFGQLVRRVFLGPLRPFSVKVVDLGTEETVLSLRRPFRFIFHRVEVAGPNGQLIGAIQRRWSWLRRIYVIEDASGNVVADIFGPILRPWTFDILVNGQVRGMVQKRWSGLLKEAFTDADNFGVEIGELGDPQLKALAFAATVLIDVVHFERRKG
jgi:uncharacterized protein YxjI